ncbi:MAG: hypothetical protein PCFJNLEI_03951 [Verrucomicrobiae bacterium]|nr:hypothetical protein [Verrucomicrobiae bacterium]
MNLLKIVVIILGLATMLRAETFDWMPAEAAGDQLRGDEAGGEQIIPEITLTATPKPTADLTKFKHVYKIDLKKFGIRNNATAPVETATGINRALQEAKAVGADRIVFPQGTYLICETNPVVIDHKNTVIDLNGATLQINSNGLMRYSVVEIVDGAENVRLTNGKLKGDRDVHDYTTVKGTHEWGTGIRFISGRNVEVDHVTASNMTGDGASTGVSGTRTRPELLARIKYSMYAKDLESGAFTEQGTKIANAEKIRTIKPYDLTTCEGQFEFGYMAGYMGYPFIKGRVYQAYFFDAEMNFVSRQKCLQYRKVTIPVGAKWMHLEFNQPAVSAEPAHAGATKGEWIARITNFRPPTDVHFHHNILAQNRRLGLAYCGGQRWLIEENRFDENGGTNPAYGVDFEDGAEAMQDVVFRRNKFRGNRNGDLVVCAGSELIFEDNEFEKSVVLWGRPHNYVFRNNRFTGGKVIYMTRTGIARIHDNRYENCKLAIVFDTKAVADGLLRKPGQTVSTPPLKLENETMLNVDEITGTYFNFSNCTIRAAQFIAGKDTRMIHLVNCRLSESSILYEAEGPEVSVKIEGGSGQLNETGPGLKRKKPVQP